MRPWKKGDLCPACTIGHISRHCDSRTCTWWLCLRCKSYGDSDKHVDARQSSK